MFHKSKRLLGRFLQPSKFPATVELGLHLEEGGRVKVTVNDREESISLDISPPVPPHAGLPREGRRTRGGRCIGHGNNQDEHWERRSWGFSLMRFMELYGTDFSADAIYEYYTSLTVTVKKRSR